MRFPPRPAFGHVIDVARRHREDMGIVGALTHNVTETTAALVNCEEQLTKAKTEQFVVVDVLCRSTFERLVEGLLRVALPLREQDVVPGHPPYFELNDLLRAAEQPAEPENHLANALLRVLHEEVTTLLEIRRLTRRFYDLTTLHPLRAIAFDQLDPLLRALTDRLVVPTTLDEIPA